VEAANGAGGPQRSGDTGRRADIRPTLNNWLEREAERHRDRGADDDLRMARQLRDLITYVEGCRPEEATLARIGTRWPAPDLDPPPATRELFLDYLQRNPGASASLLLTQFADAIEMHP
jgi:hypothetical protein